ncbi:restriction endonuclease subunit S [Vibrio parahaemolyticus]|nr:restriction endonuclease subunit S [Vibrio parahaemolyticus]EIV8636926.1 restriction endonuclease subunit S [Vibrio parahaemolyticus]EIZ1450628.1 restriction endonuclease subunit S [Vibrio parahaemolyticus]EJF4460501.1 restriction endonuclease subunit S [Vibrio parahaemolyticus]EKL0056870.1 restriction endonuclease subunit S [Vibrio parahaemolyticus]
MSSEWFKGTWGDLVELKYGKGLKNYKESNEEIPVFGTNGPVGFTSKALCDFPSIIIGRKGAYRGVHFSSVPFWVIDTAYFVVPKKDFNIKWAYYHLLTQDINALDSGSAIPSTSREDFYQLPVNMPPRWIQDEIVNNLDVLNKKINLNSKSSQTLEEMAQAIFKSWFVDFDPVKAKMNGEQPEGMDEATASFFPEKLVESELGLIPEGWSASSMGEHFNITMGQSPKGETYNEEGEGIAFFQGRRDFGFRYPDVRVYTTDPKRFAKAGDTLISVRAPVGDKNMAAIDCCIGRGVAAIKHKSDSRSFTYAFMSHIEKKLGDSGSSGTVFSSINQKELKKVSFVAPPQELIEAFHKIVDPIDQKVEVLSKEIESLSSLRDTLLPKLLSGEIELGETEEMAEVN